MSFYAVHIGRKPGVYPTWSECEEQVLGYPGARYKKFATREEAEEYVRTGRDPSGPRRRSAVPAPPRPPVSSNHVVVEVNGRRVEAELNEFRRGALAALGLLP